MITRKFNYKSVVAIGGFNPTILTPEFLKEYCSFTSDHNPQGQNTPVLTELKFGNIQFLMELNKFQIQEVTPKEVEYLFPMDVMINYLDVLKYTPLKLFGLNYNYTLSEVDLEKISALVGDPFLLEKNLDIVPISAAMKLKKRNGGGLNYEEVSFVYQLSNDIKNGVKFTFGDEDVTINNNFELNGLENNRSRINILTDKYSDLLKYDNELLSRLEL